MRYVEDIGTDGDFIERRGNAPRLYRCPQGRRKGRRVSTTTRRGAHGRVVNRRSWIDGEVGVYKARCEGSKQFQAPIPGGPYTGKYSAEVRNGVAHARIRDRLPYRLVQQRLQEDFRLMRSRGYIHAGFLGAHPRFNREAQGRFVQANFSGVLCSDEVHDRGRTRLVASDPLNTFTGFFPVVKKTDQPPMEAVLQQRKGRGLEVRVAITDGSPLYKDSRQSYGADLEHQWCIFQVIKEVNKRILDGVRAIKNDLRRQGNKGRKKPPGRPGKKAPPQRQRRQGLSKKAPAPFIWEPPQLIVGKQAELTDQDKDDGTLMLLIAPELELFRRFKQQVYRLFEKGLSQQAARYRRTRLVTNPAYQANPFLARAMKKLAKEKFDPMIVFLAWENGEATHNHVERNTRVFRRMQKTRYKRRKTHTLEKAVELELQARMMQHPLYQAERKEVPVTLAEPSRLKRAAQR